MRIIIRTEIIGIQLEASLDWSKNLKRIKKNIIPQLVLCSVVFYVCLGYLQQTINQHIAAFCLWLQLPLDTLHPLDTFAF